MEFDLIQRAFRKKSNEGKNIYLKDIWPTNKEIEDTLKDALECRHVYKKIFKCFRRA